MKKLLFFCMSAAMLASCSSEEPAAPGNNGNDEIVMGVSGLNVSTSVKGTKAAMDDFDGTEQFTVFGLAKNTGTDWTNEANRLFTTGYAIGELNGRTGDDFKHTMHFVDEGGEEVHYYYPAYNGNNYSFFACFPAVAGAPTIGQNSVTVNYTIDGKTDIMLASASANPAENDGVDGYNAPFFRREGAQLPSLTFNHMLSQLNFIFVKSNDFGTNEELKVESIKIKNTYNSAVMTVATFNPEGNALVSNFAGKGDKNADMDVYSAADEVVSDFIVLDQGGDVNEAGYTMLIPQDEYEVEAVLYTVVGGKELKRSTVSSTIKRNDDAGSFLAGTKYNVTFTIAGKVEIKIADVDVTPWQEEEVDGGEMGI